MQSISHTKSGCFSTCSIDSAIFIFFQSFPTFCYFVYHLLLSPGTGRFFRNRRCDFQQSNVAMLVFFFFCIHLNSRACSKYTFIRSLLAHFAVLPLRLRRAKPKINWNSNNTKVEIPLSAFPNSTTSKLAGFFFTLPAFLMLSVRQEAVNTNFKVIGLTGISIKPENTPPKAYALNTRPS